MTQNVSTYNIELRDKAGNLKQYLTPWATDISWEWNRIGGCGRCSMKINLPYRHIDFSAGDDIQIRIKSGSTTKLMYRGWISGINPSLSDSQVISLDIRGYFDRLQNIVVQDVGDKSTYVSMLVSDIVDEIVDNFIIGNTPITKGTIDSAIFTVDTISFKTKLSEVLATLADLEGNVEYGVDEDLVFFWRTADETLKNKFFVGNNIAIFERKIDWSKLVNKIYFEGGEVGGVKFLRTAEAVDSQAMYFLSESILTNTAIITSSVADQYLGAKLKGSAIPTISLRAKIVNTDKRIEDTVPLGQIAIYDPDYDSELYTVGEAVDGGSDLTVGLTDDGGSDAVIGGVFQGQIDKITYSLADTPERFNAEITLGLSLLDVSSRIKQIELLLSNLRQG